MEREAIDPMEFIEPNLDGRSTTPANSTRDFLNVFLELAMRLEQLPQRPEIADHVIGWRPTEADQLRQQLVSDAIYHALSAHSRERFDDCAKELDNIALASVAAVRRQFRDGAPRSFDDVTPVCSRAAHKMRVVLSRASRLVEEPSRRRA